MANDSTAGYGCRAVMTVGSTPATSGQSEYKLYDYAGAAFNTIFKGDPVSQTALLSTTIQINMLMSRMLDPVGNSLSTGFFGQRVFSFTDELDVANRLYFQFTPLHPCPD